MFFGCRASGEKNDFKSYNNGVFAVIIAYGTAFAKKKIDTNRHTGAAPAWQSV